MLTPMLNFYTVKYCPDGSGVLWQDDWPVGSTIISFALCARDIKSKKSGPGTHYQFEEMVEFGMLKEDTIHLNQHANKALASAVMKSVLHKWKRAK